MTDFDALIYTDCRPGQGLSGGAGLQFQAASDDVDGDATALVQRHLLYEPPASWMREQRPVAEYPRSFAHIGTDQLATAAGVYLGREANGTREGNQLTHAIVTRDPHSYGMLRPAQLLGAPFWRATPAETQRCDRVPAGPPPGVLDTETVHTFVRAHPDGPDLLTALLTVLSRAEDEQPPQVLFIADQPEPVLTWIAAATLLLPQHRALRIGFKVFTTAPTRSSHRILAVHPDWDTPPASVDRPAGYMVVDLLAGRWSDTEPSATAARWAELFCSRDPFDVTDAVQLAAGSGLAPDPAMSLALVAVLQEQPAPAHAEAMVGWLTSGPEDLVSAYGPPVAARFTDDVTAQPPALLRMLDRATRDGALAGQAVPVRMAWLAAELSAARTSGRPIREPVPPVTPVQWGVGEAEDALALTVETLRAARLGGFAAVLDVAGSFDIPVRHEEISNAAELFVAHWATAPDIPYRWQRWPCGEELFDRLRDHLNAGLSAGTLSPVTVGDAWYRRMPVTDPGAPLDAALLAARMAHDDEAGRSVELHAMVARAAAAPDAAHQVGALSRCLWRRTTATGAELRALASAAPEGTRIDPAPIDDYLAERRRAGTLTATDIDLIGDMAKRILSPTTATRTILDDDRRLREVCAALPRAEKYDPDLAGRLEALAAAVLRVHRTLVFEALLDTPVPRNVWSVLDLTPPAFQRDYARAAATRLKDRPEPRAVATAMVVADRCTDQPTADLLTAAVNKWVSWAGAGPVDKVTVILQTREHTSAYDRWLALLEANRIRRGRSWLRGSRGR